MAQAEPRTPAAKSPSIFQAPKPTKEPAKRFDYRFILLHSNWPTAHKEDTLNELGQLGFELVGILGDNAIMKRLLK